MDILRPVLKNTIFTPLTLATEVCENSKIRCAFSDLFGRTLENHAIQEIYKNESLRRLRVTFPPAEPEVYLRANNAPISRLARDPLLE